jgi:hypothetical protein
MAYLGTTQASSVSNPPIRIWGGMGAGVDVRITGGTTMYVSGAGVGRNFGQQGWVYHTTDITSAVLASGYFTDAKVLGVRPGDVFTFVQQATSVPSSQMLRFNVVSQVTSDGAAFSTASFISGTS